MSKATLSKLKNVIDKAPFRCALGVAVIKNGKYSSCTLGDAGIFPTASIIKVAILMELFDQFKDGTLQPDAYFTLKESDIVEGGILCECGVERKFTLREMARLMIIVSDNTAANVLLKCVGMDNVNARLRSLGLKNTVMRRSFMADASQHGENTATCAEFLKVMRAFDTFNTPQDKWYQEAMNYLHNQFFIEKIPADLPPNAWVANKTGELEGVRHDVAIIVKGKTRMHLVALTADVENSWVADRTIAKLARICYNALP